MPIAPVAHRPAPATPTLQAGGPAQRSRAGRRRCGRRGTSQRRGAQGCGGGLRGEAGRAGKGGPGPEGHPGLAAGVRPGTLQPAGAPHLFDSDVLCASLPSRPCTPVLHSYSHTIQVWRLLELNHAGSSSPNLPFLNSTPRSASRTPHSTHPPHPPHPGRVQGGPQPPGGPPGPGRRQQRSRRRCRPGLPAE